MNLDDFRRLFGDTTQAWLAWDRLAVAGATIQEQIVTDRAELGRLRTVWYRDAGGGPGDWRDPGSVPLSVREAADQRSTWAPARSKRIEAFRQEYLRQTEPVLMMMPGYVTPLGTLLIDSTHRAVAAYLSNVEPRLLVLAIDGPISAEILPDLPHHATEDAENG
jgi:hypothetical protein